MKEIYLILLIILLGHSSCNNKNYCNFFVAEGSRISFQLVDPNGISIIGDYWKTYRTNDVKFQLDSGESPSGLQFGGEGTIYFDLVEAYQHGLDTIENTYFIILPPQGLTLLSYQNFLNYEKFSLAII